MNIEECKEIIKMREEIVSMKDEILKLNNLVFDMIKEIKSNAGIKIKSENSKEIDEIIRNCLDNF